MNLTYVPLLRLQRDLYAIPRGTTRFEEYLATMIDGPTGELKLPLSAMNPMGKDHVPALLDGWMALDTDGSAARAVAHAALHLGDMPGDFQVGLVIADDAKGTWTNRHFTDFGHRFESEPYHRRGWLTGLLWTTELPSLDVAREAVLMAVYRGAYIEQHGYAATLRGMMAQEGYAMTNAVCASPALSFDDLDYTRDAIAEYLEATDQATIMACLYGDRVASTLGYPPRGFSDHAGFAVALATARTHR